MLYLTLIIAIKLFQMITFSPTMTLSSLITFLTTFIGFGITLAIFFKKNNIENQRRSEDKSNEQTERERLSKLRHEEKIFSQIQLAFKRVIDLIKNSNNNTNWVTARALLEYIIELRKKLEDTAINESYNLEKLYYQKIIEGILQSAPGHKYFFGLPEEDTKDIPSKTLYNKTNGCYSQLTGYGERILDEKLPFRISPCILIFFMRFVLFDEFTDTPVFIHPFEKFTSLEELNLIEKIKFENFRAVYAYIQTIEHLRSETKDINIYQLQSEPIT